MKRIRTFVIAICCIVLVGLACYIWRATHHVSRRPIQKISDAYVTAVAAKFEDPHARILLDDHYGKLTGAKFRYRITAHTVRASRYQFFLNGTAFYGPGFHMLYRRPHVTEAEACRIAWKYVVLHFQASHQLNTLYIPMPGGQLVPHFYGGIRFYYFCFYYNPDGSAMGPCPCQCEVCIESLTGRIIRYWSADYPITVSSKPSISLQTAVANTMSKLVTDGKNARFDGLQIPIPDEDGNERLLYFVTFDGTGPREDSDLSSVPGYNYEVEPLLELNEPPVLSAELWPKPNHYRAAVDGHTGEFIGWNFNDWQKGKKILPWPPTASQTNNRK